MTYRRSRDEDDVFVLSIAVSGIYGTLQVDEVDRSWNRDLFYRHGDGFRM